MLDRIAGKVSDVAQVEQQARMEGRQMSMMLVGR
jgi:translation initiation factor IF-3